MRYIIMFFISCTILPAAQVFGEEAAKSITARDGSVMVLVPAGEFVMGSGEGKPDERPPHTVNLPSYYIDKNEVTNAQYFQFMTQTHTPPPLNWEGAKFKPKTDHWPVTGVSWFDAMRYAAWAGKRLPTEAEWEKAARGTDGRRFPWGNEDQPDARNLSGSEGVHPVGENPKGASPYGCLDMAGNAWEWVADWYEAYPSSDTRSVHFGHQYKSIRGGGSIYFYGIDNTGRCSQRGRLVSFGNYDALGFRCVQDLPGAKLPYEQQKLLDEAEVNLKSSLKPPVTLAFEKEFQEMSQAGQFKLRVAGAAGQAGMVRSGIPFAKGQLKDSKSIQIMSESKSQPVQTRVLETWDDNSPRWVLVDFPARTDATYNLRFGSAQGAGSVGTASLKIQQEGQTIRLDTGVITAAFSPDSWIKEVKWSDGAMIVLDMHAIMRVGQSGSPTQLQPLPAEKMAVEDAGPLHAVVRLAGKFAGPDGQASPFRYDLRIHATAGSSQLNVLLTLTHFAERIKAKSEYEKPMPSVSVLEASVSCNLAGAATQIVFGGDRGVHSFPAGNLTELLQPDDLTYSITQAGKRIGGGTRAPGWVTAKTSDGSVTLGQRHFWQHHAEALDADSKALTLKMWAGKEPFEWEAGLAKTHEIVLNFSKDAPNEKVVLEPMRVVMPPSWACGTGAAGTLLPRGPEALERFAYWELLRDAAKRNWVKSMPFGMRDFGDAYMGGPYKGKNAYTNLEYDVPMNFIMDFLKTGQVWLLNAAELQARHQVDIDVDHFNGRVWKHSPQHTTTEAEFGHVFIRGMLLHYLLTGEQRSLDVAREIGDWMAPKVAKLDGIGNERQIGWSTYALTALYDVTKDKKYLDAAHTACTKLSAGQSATGKFKIRWDNRISFMNGIAMMGMLTVYEFTADEAVARAILAVAQRTMGFYPEYACRTLNAFCWAAQRTNDPRYIVAMERTWSSSMEFLMGRDSGVTEEVYAWLFTWFACKHQLFPLFETKPDLMPDPASYRGLRLDQPQAELFLKGTPGQSSAVMLIVEGQTPGVAELFDSSGKIVKAMTFKGTAREFEPAAFVVPSTGGTYRLHLNSPGAQAWQVHYDGHTRVTVYDTGMNLLPVIYPRATGFLKEGAKEVKVKLEAVGEGFHAATLYDPAGHPVAVVRKFVDFQDPNRYEVELKAPVTGESRGWSLEVYNAKVLSIDGLLPYWAGDNQQLFNPERPNE